MDCPCNCDECGDLYDFGDMWFPENHWPESYSRNYCVCKTCYNNIKEFEDTKEFDG